MGIVVIGAVFVDVKGYPNGNFVPTGRNAGRVERVHGGVGRNVAEDIANCELRPTFVSLVDESGDGADVIRKLKNHKVNTDLGFINAQGFKTPRQIRRMLIHRIREHLLSPGTMAQSFEQLQQEITDRAKAEIKQARHDYDQGMNDCKNGIYESEM